MGPELQEWAEPLGVNGTELAGCLGAVRAEGGRLTTPRRGRGEAQTAEPFQQASEDETVSPAVQLPEGSRMDAARRRLNPDLFPCLVTQSASVSTSQLVRGVN